MVLNGLNYPENRPFIKDLKINCNDYFILDMIKNYEKKNRKKWLNVYTNLYKKL